MILLVDLIVHTLQLPAPLLRQYFRGAKQLDLADHEPVEDVHVVRLFLVELVAVCELRAVEVDSVELEPAFLGAVLELSEVFLADVEFALDGVGGRRRVGVEEAASV